MFVFYIMYVSFVYSHHIIVCSCICFFGVYIYVDLIIVSVTNVFVVLLSTMNNSYSYS